NHQKILHDPRHHQIPSACPASAGHAFTQHLNSRPPNSPHLKHHQTTHISQRVHINQHKHRPPPPARLTLHDRDRAHALHRQHEPHEQAESNQGRPHGLAVGVAIVL